MLALCALPLILTFGSTTAYYYFVIHAQLSGDLGRLGGIPFGNKYSDSLNIPRLTQNWVDQYTLDLIPQDTTCITIGDSFSQQGQLGYQNFMAHALGRRVININSEVQPIQTALNLLNSGFFDSLRPQIVIVEIVERNLPHMLTDIDFKSDLAIAHMLPYKSAAGETLTTASLVKYTYNWLSLKFKQNPVNEATLDAPLFTLRPQKLYFYRDDLYSARCAGKTIESMRESLEQLHGMFAQHGIRFLLVVAVDKYDLYQSHIVENPHITKTLLDQLGAACDSTQLINTKQLLSPLVERDVHDVYYANDSHWTQTAAEIIGTHLAQICLSGEPNKDIR